jgi:four helix bundle protein
MLFRNLPVYKKSSEFRLFALQTIEAKNNIKRNTLDQLDRASLSIILNIAEGSGKITKPDRRKFFATARGSLFECIAIIDVLTMERILTVEEAEHALNLANEVSKLLYTMIKNLSNIDSH